MRNIKDIWLGVNSKQIGRSILRDVELVFSWTTYYLSHSNTSFFNDERISKAAQGIVTRLAE